MNDSPPRVLKVSAQHMGYLRRLVRADIRRHNKHITRWHVKPGQPEDEARAALDHMLDAQAMRRELLEAMERQTGEDRYEQEAQRSAPGQGAEQLQGTAGAARVQLDADDGRPGHAAQAPGEREAAAGLDDGDAEGGR